MNVLTNIILAVAVFTCLYYLAKWVNEIINDYDKKHKERKKNVLKQ